MSGVWRLSGEKASGCEPKTGDDVGREKASWVDDRAWPLLRLRWLVSCDEKSDENHPIDYDSRYELIKVVVAGGVASINTHPQANPPKHIM